MEDLREENLNIDSKRVLSELKTGKIVCNIVFEILNGISLKPSLTSKFIEACFKVFDW